MPVITTSKCESCVHGEIIEKSKSYITVHCKIRNKDYQYGQRIPCDDRKAKKNEKA